MNTEIPHLKIERLPNGCIRLENESCGDSYVVDIHPLHLRYMAEQLGLIREMSASEADALRTVAELRRRMLVLNERIDHLGEWLNRFSDTSHTDLDYEQAYATATADICQAFCSDFQEVSSHSDVTPGHAASRVTSVGVPRDQTQTEPTGFSEAAKTPEHGTVEQSQKRDASSKPTQRELLA
ncbi:hypothetical protein J2X90_005587 [Variovorax paradoxus]|uniref:hypothetical protein n=1 Tax=Variovorax paradoxus TaxID=34073 RepID=UPI0027883E59|nr:hypothetical protein [Variovorax paradoxus]MDQ0027751.1 hypothetical protein [Variovorax paradoxus]